MKLCSIASGSSGNCIYVASNSANILVDAGISGKRIENGLQSIDVDPKDLDAILITHEHSDHVLGIGVMARRYNIPLYSTVETLNALMKIKSIGRIDAQLFHYIEPDQGFVINDMKVMPFSISHDASNPVCYTFEHDGHKVGVATDLGKYDEYIVSHLKDSEALLLEANHDVNMLQVGSYPYHLKRRILGEYGHLSNDHSGQLITELLCKKLKTIFLGHLSKENNYPDLAYETVKLEIEKCKNDLSEDLTISVAKRDEPSPLITL